MKHNSTNLDLSIIKHLVDPPSFTDSDRIYLLQVNLWIIFLQKEWEAPTQERRAGQTPLTSPPGCQSHLSWAQYWYLETEILRYQILRHKYCRRRLGMGKQWSMDETQSWFRSRSSSQEREQRPGGSRAARSHRGDYTRSSSHSICQSLSLSVTQSVSHSICLSLSLSVTQSISHSICQSLNLSVTQSVRALLPWIIIIII